MLNQIESEKCQLQIEEITLLVLDCEKIWKKTYVEFEKVKSKTKLIMNCEFSTVIHVSTRIIP